MATVYDLNHETLADGLQGCDTCDEAIQMARKIAAERGEQVLLVDDDGEWILNPDGSLG